MSNLQILDRGEGQVGAAERTHMLESMRRDIAVIIAEKTLNPENGRPYTPSMIERVLAQDVQFSIRTDDTAKQQVYSGPNSSHRPWKLSNIWSGISHFQLCGEIARNDHYNMHALVICMLAISSLGHKLIYRSNFNVALRIPPKFNGQPSIHWSSML